MAEKIELKVEIKDPNNIHIDLSEVVGAMLAVAVRLTSEACAKEAGYKSFRESGWSVNWADIAQATIAEVKLGT